MASSEIGGFASSDSEPGSDGQLCIGGYAVDSPGLAVEESDSDEIGGYEEDVPRELQLPRPTRRVFSE